MTTTQQTRYASDGAVRQDGPLPITTCDDCGKEMVWATSNRTGKKYRVAITKGYLDQRFYMKNNFHTCDPESVAARKRAAEADTTTIRKGTTVEVIKGRKYPIGTQGEVFWIAPQADDYGVVKIGAKDADGNKMWINIDNVKRVG
jgi:hypothetical protein